MDSVERLSDDQGKTEGGRFTKTGLAERNGSVAQ